MRTLRQPLRRRPHKNTSPRSRSRQAGYAYLMALFMVLTVVVTSQVILHNLVNDERRQREDDVIWRGEQYTRAIRSYYRKTGHYPQSPDDLAKGVGNVHFLRSEVAVDPMNKEDGTWGFIYTNAAGQIFGSRKYGSLQQMALMEANGGKMPGATQNPGDATSGSVSISSTAGGVGSSPAPGQVALGSPFPKPTGPVDGPVIGGQLSGVVSKVDHPSLKVYKGGTNYNEWEFIWNPVADQARAVQQGLGPQSPTGGIPGLPGLLPIGPTGGVTSSPGGASSNPGGTAAPGGTNAPQNAPDSNPQN